MVQDTISDIFGINQLAMTAKYVSKPRELLYEKNVKIEAELKSKNRIRLALVCLPKIVEKEPYTCNIISNEKRRRNTDSDTCGRSVAKYTEKATQMLIDNYYIAIKEVIKEKPDIICINELGFPADNSGPIKKAIEESIKIANDHKCLLVAGSYHDHRNFYNVGRVYYPYHKNEKNYDELKQKYYYHKQVSAFKTYPSERISIPPERNTLIIQAFGIRIAILICADVWDLATITGIIQDEDIKLLLIPSHSEKTDILKLNTRFISQILPGLVAVANYSDPEVVSYYLYKFGKHITLRQKNILKTHGKYYIYTIDTRNLKASVWDEKSKRTHEINWAFGLQVKDQIF